jgi:hypothetical protein
MSQFWELLAYVRSGDASRLEPALHPLPRSGEAADETMAKKRDDKQQRKREQKQKRLALHPPRLGHESMLAIPAFRAAATALSESLRVALGAAVRLVSEDDLALPNRNVKAQARASAQCG